MAKGALRPPQAKERWIAFLLNIHIQFDALIEPNLSSASVLNKVIDTEAIKLNPNELLIYHPHKFLPRSGKNPRRYLHCI